MADIADDLRKIVKGDVCDDDQTRTKFEIDASVFRIKPQIVVNPLDTSDIKSLVKYISRTKKTDSRLSLTPRAAGTCMSGGSLTESIMVSMAKFNKIREIKNDYAIVEPGVYYRDFEKEISKHDLVYPPYTSSKMICAVGGMVANNAGGEKSLKYGKAEDFIDELKVVLADGHEYTFGKLNKDQLEAKIKKGGFEGNIYKNVYKLVKDNEQVIKSAKPEVTKNSAGYNLWRVWDGKTFDLTKLIIGSQGTLGIITEIKFRILPKIKHHGMLVVYMDNFQNIPEIVNLVLAHNPDSFETYDHYTLNLALKYFYAFGKLLHTNLFGLIRLFWPEIWHYLDHGMPQLVLLVEYENDDLAVIHQNLKKLSEELSKFDNITIKITKSEKERQKYWAIRRESFSLLRRRVKGMSAAPFIDDTIVKPAVLPEFFPKLYKLLNDSGLKYTIAGHIGNGNFHIIPLMNLADPDERQKIFKVADKVFDLVWQYGGSDSGEHNDGIIRTPYSQKQFGKFIYGLFVKVKNIFDPQDIFNPGKKVNGTREYAISHIKNYQ